MKELVVISGKGGTGKTSIVAAFATLASRKVVVDCDVDAPDLHLILAPTPLETHAFSGGSCASIDPEKCTRCGACAPVCRFGAISRSAGFGEDQPYRIDPISCEGCGVCHWICPSKAIQFGPVVNGQWFSSATRHGPMIHAKLGIAQENSGKLVSTIKQAARDLAAAQALDLILIDGSPGIGCPVIASLAGADLALIVTEPTLSGLHDLQRVAELTRHFQLPAMVCINKCELNPAMTRQIEAAAADAGLASAGSVSYDPAITTAQIQRQSIVELQDHGCAAQIRQLWHRVAKHLAG